MHRLCNWKHRYLQQQYSLRYGHLFVYLHQFPSAEGILCVWWSEAYLRPVTLLTQDVDFISLHLICIIDASAKN